MSESGFLNELSYFPHRAWAKETDFAGEEERTTTSEKREREREGKKHFLAGEPKQSSLSSEPDNAVNLRTP